MPKVNKITKNLRNMNLNELEDQVTTPNLIKIEPGIADSVTFDSMIALPRRAPRLRSPSAILNKLGNRYANAIMTQTRAVEYSNLSPINKERKLTEMERTVDDAQAMIDVARGRMNAKRMEYQRSNEALRQQQLNDANQFVRDQFRNQ